VAAAIGSQVQRLRVAGARAYLTMPFDVRRLYAVLEAVLAVGDA
jgi:hypothetical protein